MGSNEEAFIPSVYIETLGCAKNEVDSREMAKRLRAAGVRISHDRADCDAIIVNTCSFIQAATEESIDAIFEALDEPGRINTGVRVVVAGCMPARYGADLESSIPEADRFVPCSKEDDIVEVISALFDWKPVDPDQRVEQPRITSAYLKISDGCNRWCTFCTIPSIRGPYRSFSFEDILVQARELVSEGARELILIGQDTGIWGCDLPGEHDLAWLLDALAHELLQVRFRVMYTEPDGITDELLSVMERHENICSYLDIPLQHVSPKVLKAMGRRGSAPTFEALVERIRKALPNVTLRTTLMCGFPGETEDEFEELVDFVRLGLFEYVGVFAYSQEGGTKAAKMLDQVPEDVKEMRARELRDEADSVSAALVAERVGSNASVLVEGIEEDGQLFGRAASQAPEADGITFIDAGEPGDVVDVRIEDTLLYDMEGVVL